LLLVTALFTALLPVDALATAETGSDKPKYSAVYEVNSLLYNDDAAVCIDKSDSSSTGENRCTLKRALELANGDNSPGAVLITVDKSWASNPKNVVPFRPWIMIAAGPHNEQDTSAMCYGCAKYGAVQQGTRNSVSVWNGGEDHSDSSGAYLIARDNLTIDFLGLIGVAAADNTSEYAGFVVTGKNVTLRNFNGLYSASSSVVLKPGADGFLAENGNTDQAHLPDPGSVGIGMIVPNNNFGERFLVIQGAVSNTTVRNWRIGGLDPQANAAGVLFDNASVRGLTFENLLWNSKKSSATCGANSAGACNAGGIRAIGTNLLSEVVLRVCTFSGFWGQNDPIRIGAGSTLHNWTLDRVAFTDNSSSMGIGFDYADAVQNIELSAVFVYDNTFDYGFMSMSSTAVDGFELRDSKLFANTRLRGALFAMFDTEVHSLTLTGNSFEDNRRLDNSPGVACASGDAKDASYLPIIWAHCRGAARDVVFAGNNSKSNGAGSGGTQSGLYGWDYLTQIAGLRFINNTSTDDVLYADYLSLNNAVSMRDVQLHKNTISNLSMRKLGGQVFALPAIRLGGNNVISENTVSLKPDFSYAHLVNWSADATLGNAEMRSSNLKILRNKLSNFKYSAIRIAKQGLTEIRFNTFSAVSTHKSAFTGVDEEKLATDVGGYMVQNLEGSNRQIRAWYPASAKVDNKTCAVSVTVKDPGGIGSAANTPVTLDFYATTDGNAQIYVGSATALASGQSVSVDVRNISGIGAQYLRIQTSETQNGATGSSQYSRWKGIGRVNCADQPMTITKTAYWDQDASQPIGPNEILHFGDQVFWLYTVANRSSKAIEATVTDDKLVGSVVCKVQIPANSTRTCLWQQTMSPQVVSHA
jgi:hypothetical protein